MIDDPKEIQAPLSELAEFVNRNTAKILAILSLMHDDEGVEWNTMYGHDLIKLERDTRLLFRQAQKTTKDLERFTVFVDYKHLRDRHRTTLECLDAYMASS